MKPQELRIGNEISIYNHERKVVEVGLHGILATSKGGQSACGFDHPTLRPIPITPEWLRVKGAFYPYNDERLQIGNVCFYDGKGAGLFVQDSGYNETISEGIMYRHQLQNLFFDLTGKEL